MPFRLVRLARAKHPLHLAVALAGNTAEQKRIAQLRGYQSAGADLYDR